MKARLRLALGVLALLAATPAAAALSPAEQVMVRTVDAEQPRTLTMLEKWVNQNSGTLNLPGVAAVGADSPDKQELSPELLGGSKVVVDILEQCASIGELHHALYDSNRDWGATVSGELDPRVADVPERVSFSVEWASKDLDYAAALSQFAREQTALEAAQFYAKTFPDSAVGAVMRASCGARSSIVPPGATRPTIA